MKKHIKEWSFVLSVVMLIATAFIFLSTTNDKLASDPDYFNILSLTDNEDYQPQGIREEVARIPQTSQVAIVGYEKQIYMPTRTLVMFNGEPMFLKRVLTKEDTANELDFVLMADNSVFICLHERIDKCWPADSLSATPEN
ncbi:MULTISPECIES: hypothetical protein [unclassified Providencia]|uniref:hypothetical protein n=1 Tax=unclassified Providencia TaxID=2633465 RepID=UPI00234AFB7B|nr:MULTISPECIES: hypothetical protein [unclassified Providencia]